MSVFTKRRQAAFRHARAIRNIDPRDVGIRVGAADALTLDDEPVVHIRHYVTARSTQTACKLTGYAPHTNAGTDSAGSVTCADCKAALAKRGARRTARRVA